MSTQQPTPSAPTPSAPTPAPLWPQPIPVLGLTGEKWSGKTLFGLTIDPARTLIYDTEKSSLSYQALGFTRVDVMAEMFRLHPKGHKPVERFEWWLNHVRSLPAGRFSVIVTDTVNEIESGLADWVNAHPEYFGHTKAQYLKMSGIMWGDVKDFWLSILSADLAGRCETFVFITHMGDVWGSDNKPTGKRKPKGKDTLFQLASLYLQMERPKNLKGEVQQVPSARVLKDRMAAFRPDPATGEIKILPLLPPRIPVATPHAIRQYMLSPPDFSKLRPEEMAPDDAPVTEAEMIELRLRTAEAERDAEQAKLERELRQQQVRQGARGRDVRATAAPQAAAGAPPASGNGHATPTTAAPPPRGTVTDDQLRRIKEYRDELFRTVPEADRKAQWAGILAKRRVTSAVSLSTEQAEDLCKKLGHALDLRMIAEGCNHGLQPGSAPQEVQPPVAGGPLPPIAPLPVKPAP